MQTIYDDTTHANENTLADMSAISLSLSFFFLFSASFESYVSLDENFTTSCRNKGFALRY